MRVDDFDYYLPKNLIAQTPLLKRSESKLMIINPDNSTIHTEFNKIIDYLEKDDYLVINNTKVIPSRIYGHKEDTNAFIEMLLLKDMGAYFEVLARPSRRLKEGSIVTFNDLFKGKVIKKLEDGLFHVEFLYQGIFYELLEQYGQMPLPPYIKEKLEDQNRYQTVYSKDYGSSAAPTAGLHFTNELLDKIKAKGVNILEITLHIGLGTFRPVSVSNILEHKMHCESYLISDEVACKLNEAKRLGKKIIAVGTTTTRTLEANFKKHKCFKEESSETDIFIYPGYQFQAIDGLITNFHLPKSTLLMLVSAFKTKEIMLHCYQEAINNEYRFFSFGDCMFIRK